MNPRRIFARPRQARRPPSSVEPGASVSPAAQGRVGRFRSHGRRESPPGSTCRRSRRMQASGRRGGRRRADSAGRGGRGRTGRPPRRLGSPAQAPEERSDFRRDGRAGWRKARPAAAARARLERVRREARRRTRLCRPASPPARRPRPAPRLAASGSVLRNRTATEDHAPCSFLGPTQLSAPPTPNVFHLNAYKCVDAFESIANGERLQGDSPFRSEDEIVVARSPAAQFIHPEGGGAAAILACPSRATLRTPRRLAARGGTIDPAQAASATRGEDRFEYCLRMETPVFGLSDLHPSIRPAPSWRTAADSRPPVRAARTVSPRPRRPPSATTTASAGGRSGRRKSFPWGDALFGGGVRRRKTLEPPFAAILAGGDAELAAEQVG